MSAFRAPAGSRGGKEFRDQSIDPIGEFPGGKSARFGDHCAPRSRQLRFQELGGIEEVWQVVLAVVEQHCHIDERKAVIDRMLLAMITSPTTTGASAAPGSGFGLSPKNGVDQRTSPVFSLIQRKRSIPWR